MPDPKYKINDLVIMVSEEGIYFQKTVLDARFYKKAGEWEYRLTEYSTWTLESRIIKLTIHT